LSNNCKQAELVTTFNRKLKSELLYLHVAYGKQSTDKRLVITEQCLWFGLDLRHY